MKKQVNIDHVCKLYVLKYPPTKMEKQVNIDHVCKLYVLKYPPT